jgi:hypothetical protein
VLPLLNAPTIKKSGLGMCAAQDTGDAVRDKNLLREHACGRPLRVLL